MSVTHLTEELVEHGVLAELVDQIDHFVGTTLTAVTLEAAKAAVKAAGVARMRDMYLDGLEEFRQAQEAKRLCDTSVSDDRKLLADVVADVEWELGAHFDTRANKTWLVRNLDGTAIAETDQRSFTADEKKAWIARTADRTPNVADAKRRLALTEAAAHDAADRVALADRSLQAARHLLDAAVAELETYRLAIAAPNRKEHTR